MGWEKGAISDMPNSNFHAFKEKVDTHFPLKMAIPAIGMGAASTEIIFCAPETTLGSREGRSTNFVNQETN